MSLIILDASTRAAVAAATNQEAQRAALLAPWAGGDVTVRTFNGATLRDVGTYGPWTLIASASRSAQLGNLIARTGSSTGPATLAVFQAGGTDIFSLSLATSPATADIVLPALSGGIMATARTNFSDPGVGRVTISADPSLPVTGGPAPSLTWTGPSTGTVGVPSANFTATLLNGTVPVVVTPSSVPSGTWAPTSRTLTPGGSPSGTFTLTALSAAVHAASLANDTGIAAPPAVSYTAAPPPPAPSPPADFVARRSAPGVIAWQGFEADSEVTAFAKPRDVDFDAVPLYRESDPVVGSALVFKFLGARLAADFLASGGNGPRPMVLDDASDWPTTFPFRFFVTRVPLGTSVTRKKTLFECSARTGNTLTVTYVPLGISEFDSGASFMDRFIGDAAGSECQNYSRLFSAMTGADNGKGVDDPAANGTLPVRSRIPGNPNRPPMGPSMFGYGYCAHPDYVSDPRFNPWVPGYQGTGLGDGVSRSNIIDTSEIYIQFRAWFDADTQLPDMVGGKIVGIQTETTTPQQIVMGMGPGGGNFSIPSTPEVPFALSKFSPTTFGSAGLTMAANPYSPNGSSYQPGSFEPVSGKSWAATAIHAVSGLPSTGQDTPDGNSAWEHKYGRWVTFLWRIRPGKAWHFSVAIKTAWNSATQDTLTLLDSPDEWPTENFQIVLDIGGAVFNVASRVGAVLSGVTLVSGSHVNLPPFSSTWVQKFPVLPAGAGALNTLLEIKFADEGDTEYTTLFSDDDHPIIYGSRGQAPNYFDDSIAGFSAVDFWGYRNTDLSSVAPYKTLFQKFAQLIISKDPIPVPALDLPDWRPAPGEVATLTNTNGGLTNRWRDAIDAYYEPFYAVKAVNDYSGAFKNPYWGQYGATIFFGGGHAGTNYNGVIAAEYGKTAITFKRLCSATPWFGTGTDIDTRTNNGGSTATNPLTNLNYMESLLDGKPGSPHSYGSGDVIGPEYGGAPYGSFLRVVTAAVNRVNDNGTIAAHRLDLNDLLTGTATTRNWVRDTDEFRSDLTNWFAPQLTAFVGPQQRVYVQTNNSTTNVRWYDRVAKTWVNGTGTTFGYDFGDGFDSGIMFYVPSRGLLICMYPQGGVLRVQWMDVTVAQPTLGGTATLSETLTIGIPWSAGCWCVHNNRIVLIGANNDNAAAYEIAIPATLTNTWPVERAPFGAGQTLYPPDDAAGTGFTYKKWHYDERARCIVYMPSATVSGDDTVRVYTPRNT